MALEIQEITGGLVGGGAVGGLVVLAARAWVSEKLKMLSDHDDMLKRVAFKTDLDAAKTSFKQDLEATADRLEDALERTGEQLTDALGKVADATAATHRRIDDFLIAQTKRG